MDIENGRAHVTTEFLDRFTYNGKEYDAGFFKDHTAGVLLHLLDAAARDKEDLKARLAADGIKIKLDGVYPLVRFAAKKISTVSVGKAAGLVNALTLGRGIDKQAVKAVKNDNLLQHILTVFLNVFDGSFTAARQKDEVKTIVLNVSTLPHRVITKLPLGKGVKEKTAGITESIGHIANELMFPSPPDNGKCDISLC